MTVFLQIVFIFYLGSTFGWIIELIFRRIVHKKWVNPGFLIGPYLPIYGFGLVFLTIIYFIFHNYLFFYYIHCVLIKTLLAKKTSKTLQKDIQFLVQL